MADVTYRIVIENAAGAGGSGSSGSERSVASTTDGESMDNPIAKFVKGVETIKKMAPVAYALKYADTVITTEINRVGLRTGHTTLQEQISWAYSTSKSVIASASMIVGGLATQNYVAAIAGVATLANTGFQYGIARQNINLQRNVENVGIGMANIRAGAGGDRTGKSNY